MLSASLEILPRSIIVAFAENILAPAPSKWTALVNVLVRRLTDDAPINVTTRPSSTNRAAHHP